MKTTLSLLMLALLLTGSSLAGATRVITDQLGRQVTLPDRIDRVVVLQHQTLNLLVQLNATDKIVGIMANWQQLLGSHYARLVPTLSDKVMLGDLTHVDPEKLVMLHPQLVFVTHYAPPAMLARISALGIPVVAISLRHDAPDMKTALNPALKDEEQAYRLGLREAITLVGNIVNKPAEARDLIAAMNAGQQCLHERLRDLPAGQRVRAYLANPQLTTYGSGKYTGLMMAHAGALNVAAATVQGFRQVSLEQIIRWDPQVIFVQDRYPQVVEEITQDEKWQPIAAVKNHRVYRMPEYAKAWGYPMPEAVGLGELWMAKKLYPARFQDVDMQALANRWYLRFYRHPYQGDE